MFCAAVKHAKRLTKRLNENKKSTEDSDSDGDDLVRLIDQSVHFQSRSKRILVARNDNTNDYIIYNALNYLPPFGAIVNKR